MKFIGRRRKNRRSKWESVTRREVQKTKGHGQKQGRGKEEKEAKERSRTGGGDGFMGS